jgi:hypothetical protein
MNYNRPRLRSRLTALFTLILTIGLLIMPATAGADDHDGPKVTICRDLGDGIYQQAEVTKAQAINAGYANIKEGDIIPSFVDDKLGVYIGQNWDAAGQAIWNNGCEVPPVPLTCPTGFTKDPASTDTVILCTRIDTQTNTVIEERIVERIVEVIVEVPALPEELPTGPAAPETEESSDPILPTEVPAGFGPAQNDSPIAWYAYALMGLSLAGAGYALRRN